MLGDWVRVYVGIVLELKRTVMTAYLGQLGQQQARVYFNH